MSNQRDEKNDQEHPLSHFDIGPKRLSLEMRIIGIVNKENILKAFVVVVVVVVV